MTVPSPEPTSLRGWVRLLVDQFRELGFLYLASARREVEAGVGHLKAGLILLSVALGLAAVATMVVVLLGVAVFSAITGWPMWLAALVVLAVLVVLIVLVAWLATRRLRRARFMPEETMSAVKEDLEWAQRWTKRA